MLLLGTFRPCLVGLLAVAFAPKSQKLNQRAQKPHQLLPKISFHLSTNPKAPPPCFHWLLSQKITHLPLVMEKKIMILLCFYSASCSSHHPIPLPHLASGPHPSDSGEPTSLLPHSGELPSPLPTPASPLAPPRRRAPYPLRWRHILRT